MPIICLTALLTGLDLWSYTTSLISITSLSHSLNIHIQLSIRWLSLILRNPNLKPTTFSFSLTNPIMWVTPWWDWSLKQNHWTNGSRIYRDILCVKEPTETKTASSFLDTPNEFEKSNATPCTPVQQQISYLATEYWSTGWLHGTVVERQSLASKLSLFCAQPAADGWPLLWVNCPLQVSQLSLSSFRGRWMSSKLESDGCYCGRHLVKATKVTAGLAESNGSLPPDEWLKVNCRLTAWPNAQ